MDHELQIESETGYTTSVAKLKTIQEISWPKDHLDNVVKVSSRIKKNKHGTV